MNFKRHVGRWSPDGYSVIKVDVDQLTCVSAIKLAKERFAPIADINLGNQTKIQIARSRDVLYLPSVLLKGQSLQIIDRLFVPIEGIFHTFTLDFVKQQMMASKKVFYDKGFEVNQCGEEVCILGNVFSRNFTHWHEEIMKVIVIERSGVECTYVIADLPPFAMELLLLLGVPKDRILLVAGPTIFHSALYTTPVHYWNITRYPEVLFALRDALYAIDVSGEPACGPRLWLDRGQQTRLGRALVNVEEVRNWLQRHEFAVVDMAAHSLRTQISIARQMEVLAGIHGSHFVHTQLMRRRSSIIECFSPLYLNPTYTEIYRILDHRYFMVCPTNTPVFPYKHGTDVEVDCSQLALALKTVFEFERAT